MDSFAQKTVILILIWTTFVSDTYSNQIQKFCPKNCRCDVFNDYRRADCSDQNLINTFSGVPEEVEVLDLSRNQIALINDHSFEEYTNIVILDLSYNIIDTLALKAFEPMKYLQKLDLSYNRIEQMDNRLFESNPKLTHLDLSGNKFMSLADHALIKSASLTELVLVDCKLVHISHLMFHAVPNLRSLDLSQNLLKSIHIKPLQKMKQLQSVNLEDNSWNCDDETFKVLKWLKKRGVEVKRNQCYKPKKGHATFEKIVHATTVAPREEIPIEFLWNVTRNYIFPSENVTEPAPPSSPYKVLSAQCAGEGELDEIDHECTVDACKTNLSELYDEYKVLTTQIETYKQNHLEAVITMCYVGLFFGALGGGLVVYLCCFLRDRNIKKTFTEPLERQRLRKAYKNRSQYAHAPTAGTSENQTEDSDQTDVPRIASPITPSRIPSFRNSNDQPTLPKSLTPLRHSTSEQGSDQTHIYQRRQQPRIPQEQELPAFFKYFRRSQRSPSHRMSLTPMQQARGAQDDTYFLPSPTTNVPPTSRLSRLHSVPADPGCNPTTRPLLTNAVSNASVIYNEIDEVSEIPQDVCCTRHIRREIDAMTVDLLKDANKSRISVTPPPPYIDCMSVNRLNSRDDTQLPHRMT